MTNQWHLLRAAINEAGGLVTATGIAHMRGVSRTRANQLIDVDGFPAPFLLNETGERVWLRAEVDEWMTERWGPQYGPPIEG